MAQFWHSSFLPQVRQRTTGEYPQLAVEQHHDLLFAVEPILDLGGEFARNHLLAAGFLELLAHVDDFDFRAKGRCSTRSGSSTSAYLFFFALKYDSSDGVAEPMTTTAFRHLGAHPDRYVSGVVARGFFLLVGRVMFLVDNDQGEIGHRSEDRRPCAHNHACFAALDAVPLLGALSVGERRVEGWQHFVAENLMQVGGNGFDSKSRSRGRAGWRSVRLRGLRAWPRQVDRRLARSGDAVQKHAVEILRAAMPVAHCPGERRFLGGVQVEVEEGGTGLGAGDREAGGLFDDFDEAAA